MGGGLDESVLAWLDGTGKSVRDDCRARFRDDGEIGLILCNSAGVPLGLASQMVMPQVGRAFNVRIRGYDDEIRYMSEFDEATSKFTRRNWTRIGKGDFGSGAGIGYFCEVKVDQKYAGAHLAFNKDYAKPATPTP